MLPKKTIEAMIRVNHAGEYGALRIYEGQLKVLKNSSIASELKHMLAQEKAHLEAFEEELKNHELPPTALQPLWDKAGFIIGVGSALLGKKAAMACTVAVEEVIDDHYCNQLAILESHPAHKKLQQLIAQCHQEELEHRNIGLQKGAGEGKNYQAFSFAVKTACRAAIWLSKRL